MKLAQTRLVDDGLCSRDESPCIGAVFCSYTFDPAYFEEQVLRAVLDLQGDPEEDAARYFEEARLALQETPVACFIDASVRASGHRLPYDLLLVRRRTFHPKVYLALYETEARLAVGSGNLTKDGVEQNTEMFFTRSLRYDDPAHAAMLRDVDGFLSECVGLVGTPSAQLALVRGALANRLGPVPPRESATDARFVSSFDGALLDLLTAPLRDDEKVIRVGVLTPFFERDSGLGNEDKQAHTVLEQLLVAGADLDLAVPWDDAPIGPPEHRAGAEPVRLDDGVGSIWARRVSRDDGEANAEEVQYFVVESAKERRVEARNAAGDTVHLKREELQSDIERRRLWKVPRPTVHAPQTILHRIADGRSVRLWLHPTAELGSKGGVLRRPLHAKVFLVTTKRRGKVRTYALIGSANASRAALTRSVHHGANVEAGMLLRFDDEVTLRELLPSLVRSNLEEVELVERDALAAAPDLSAWIRELVYDPSTKTLRVVWEADIAATLERWTLTYAHREIADGTGPAMTDTLFEPFELDADSAEATFASGGLEWSLPIRVTDLAALPVNTQLTSLSLRDLLAVLGRRMSVDRLATIRAQRGPAGVAGALDAIFGEGFGATDVFRAWRGAAEELAASPTVAAFRLRLDGTTGVATIWRLLHETTGGELSADEVWVYGCELLKEIGSIELDGADGSAKSELLALFVARLREDIAGLAPEDGAHPWLAAVSAFYGLGAS